VYRAGTEAAYAQVPENIDMAKAASTATFDFAGKEDTSPREKFLDFCGVQETL
jgi:hypothetical protein